MKQQKRNIVTTVTALVLFSVALKILDRHQGQQEFDAVHKPVIGTKFAVFEPMRELQAMRELAREERPLIRGISVPESKLLTDVVCHLIIVDSFIPFGKQNNQNLTDESSLLDSSINDDNDDDKFNDNIGCVPMSGDLETQDLLVVNGLNSSWVKTNEKVLLRNELYVSFTSILLHMGSIQLMDTSTVSLVTGKKSPNIKILEDRRTLDIAVVMVSTLDSSPSFSADDVKNILFNENTVNLMTQYDACSFGKLKFKLAPIGVISIQVNEHSSSFDSGLALVTAAQFELEKIIPHSMADLGDKVMVCLPPNVGSRPWVASAGVGHWRAQFNDDWCLSLSATMHELGHTLGLTHANHRGKKYGDATGYMAAGYRSQSQPRRCFNGIKSWELGWYKSRHHWMDPFVTGDQIIKLAPLVDYDKTSSDEAVIISISDAYFVTFNRAKGMNIGSGAMRNQVILTMAGDGGSESIIGLDIGEVYEMKDFMLSGKTLFIAVCEFQRGRRDKPDIVLVSIGIGSSSQCRINTIFHRFNRWHGFQPLRL